MLLICKVRDAISNKSASMVPHDARYRYKVRQTDIILAPNQPPPPTVHDTIYMYEESDPEPPGEYIEEKSPKQHHIKNDDFDDDEDIAWFEEARYPPPDEAEQSADENDDNEGTIDGEAQQEDTDEDDDSEITTEEEEEDNPLFMQQLFNEEEDDYYDEEEEGESDDEEPVENNDDPNIPEPVLPPNLNQEPETTTILSKLPTQGKYIKFKRQQVSQIDRDLYIPTARFLYAQITQTLKKDKFGRTYFNIRYPDHSTDGIYLARGELRPNDLIWAVVEEAEFFQHAHIQQHDGARATPESLTPNTSPEQLPNLEWDHSPERLTEDEAFLWEEEPLQALAALDIVHQDAQTDDLDDDSAESQEQESITIHPMLKRQIAFRRKHQYNPGAYSLNPTPHPTNPSEVNLKTVTNLESVLDPEKPIVPEVVNLDVAQDLDLVLEVGTQPRN